MQMRLKIMSAASQVPFANSVHGLHCFLVLTFRFQLQTLATYLGMCECLSNTLNLPVLVWKRNRNHVAQPKLLVLLMEDLDCMILTPIPAKEDDKVIGKPSQAWRCPAGRTC
jgi:hypothetical protein